MSAQDSTAAESGPETLEALQTRHRKEQRDLVSRTTQKKKQATKKTRKGVNDECERLERELKEQQDAELAALNGDIAPEEGEDEETKEDAPAATANDTCDKLENLCLDSTETNTESDGRKKKPNRAKARLARRAADTAAIIAAAEQEAANAPDPRGIERERMAQHLAKHELTLHEIRADGHCLYAAMADQLDTRGIPGLTPKVSVAVATSGHEGAGVQAYKKVRHAAADFIQANPSSFDGFTEDPLPEHIRKIRETGEWGGHLELLALARSFGVRVCVLHSDGRVDRIEPGEGEERSKKGASGEVEEIWLGYYKHSHGLGEHYNSLRRTV